MKVTEEELRRLFSEEAAARQAGRERCPSPEVLAEAASGVFTSVSRESLADHLVACADCAEEFRLRGAADADADGEAAPRAARWALSSTSRSWGWAAAAAVLAAVLAIPLLRSPQPEAPNTRTQRTLEIRSAIPEDRALPRAACLLRWSPGPAGTQYTVTVAATDLTTLHTATGLSEPALEVPAAKLASVPAGGRVLWTVEAELPDGRRVRSPAFAARLE